MKRLSRTLLSLILALCILLLPVSALTVDEARELLDIYYVDGLPDGVDQAETLEELFALIGDPYTVYMTQEEFQRFLDSVNDSSLVGIGVSVQNTEQGLMIASVLDDSPALEAGLEAGDYILTVDGTPVRTTDEATPLITGEEGTTVVIGLRRKDGSLQEMELTRRLVIIPTTAQYSFTEDGTVGLIVCDSFGDGTAGHFLEAIEEGGDTVGVWVVDLRANPGGTSTAAADTAAWFTGWGVMVYFRDGQGQYLYSVPQLFTGAITDKPAIILTSPYSASGSELFAAAMRDYGKAIAVGQRTFGKGIAQITLTESEYPELFQGDAVKVTAYRFFSPGGTANQQIGVLPTLYISEENTAAAALLLCAPQPEEPENFLKLELAGLTFYVDVLQALEEEQLPAFIELLEAIPPTASLWQGQEGEWAETSPQALAQSLGLTEFKARSFTDLENCTQAAEIESLASLGLLSGGGDGSFRPLDRLSRGEFATLLAKVLGLDLSPITESSFDDVDPSAWYAPAVEAACRLRLVSGDGNGSFHPKEEITVQEVVTLLANVACQLNMYVYEGALTAPDAPQLEEDYPDCDSWTRQAMWLMDQCEIDLSDLPVRGSITRGESAWLIYQILSVTGILWAAE